MVALGGSDTLASCAAPGHFNAATCVHGTDEGCISINFLRLVCVCLGVADDKF